MSFKIDAAAGEPNWKEILSSKKGTVSYLSRRIEDLTTEVANKEIKLADTSLAKRVSWVVKIIFLAFAAAWYGFLWKASSLFKLSENKHLNHALYENVVSRLGGKASQLRNFNSLQVKSFNGHNLEASKIYFERGLSMEGKEFNLKQYDGSCSGMCHLFVTIFNNLKAKHPEIDVNEILQRAALVLKKGAPPEAAILQNFQKSAFLCEVLNPEFQVLKQEGLAPSCYNKISISRDGDRWDQFNQMKIGEPHYVVSKLGGGLHATVLIRTGPENFSFYNPTGGLERFSGEKDFLELSERWKYQSNTERENKIVSDMEDVANRVLNEYISELESQISGDDHCVIDFIRELGEQNLQSARDLKPKSEIAKQSNLKIELSLLSEEQKEIVRKFRQEHLEEIEDCLRSTFYWEFPDNSVVCHPYSDFEPSCFF